MPSIDGKNESEDEEMDHDMAESEKTGEDDESEDSGSDDSSVLDDGECEKRRAECLDGMADLERQFTDLKEQLFIERLRDIDVKLDEVKAGRAPEYLNPLSQLQENMRVRTQVAGILRELKLVSIKNKHECECHAALQHFNSEKILLHDLVRGDLEDKIRRLEEDRNNIDITSDLWNESQQIHRKKKSRHDPLNPDRRRKPVSVAGPYIVYMLRDNDIIDDWTAIKKALKQQSTQKKREHTAHKCERVHHVARYDDGRLYYSGAWYKKGDYIVIENREDSPEHALITTINAGEVWVKRSDGSKTKLYIAQLQKGKYSMKHVQP